MLMQNSPAWHAFRARSTGVSNAAVLLGFRDPKTAAKLGSSAAPPKLTELPDLLERIATGTPAPPPDERSLFFFEFGHRHEVNALAAVIRAFPGIRLCEVGVYRLQVPDGLPPMHASPDAMGVMPDGTEVVVEAKAKVPFRYDSKTGMWHLFMQQAPTTIDPAHFTQVQLQMHATQTHTAYLVVVPVTANAVVFTVRRNDEWLCAAWEVLRRTLGATRPAEWERTGKPAPGFLLLGPRAREYDAFVALTGRLCREASDTERAIPISWSAEANYEPVWLHEAADLHAYEKEILLGTVGSKCPPRQFPIADDADQREWWAPMCARGWGRQENQRPQASPRRRPSRQRARTSATKRPMTVQGKKSTRVLTRGPTDAAP